MYQTTERERSPIKKWTIAITAATLELQIKQHYLIMFTKLIHLQVLWNQDSLSGIKHHIKQKSSSSESKAWQSLLCNSSIGIPKTEGPSLAVKTVGRNDLFCPGRLFIASESLQWEHETYQFANH